MVLQKVKAGENAIIFNYLTRKFGNKNNREGYHVRIPFITRVIIFETRTRFLEETASTSNRDLQTVNFSIRVLYKPDPTQLIYLAQNTGLNYSQNIMPPIIKEVAKGIIAQYTAQQLMSQREQVSNDIKAALKERLGYFSVLIDEVSITQTSFSRDYEKAIEDKQIAQQTAERMKYIVQKAKQIKKSAIISAEAEVESIKLIGKAVKENPAYLTLQKIEAAREIADILSKSRNNILLDSNMLLVNNLNKN